MIQILSTEISQTAPQPLAPLVAPSELGDAFVSFAALISEHEAIDIEAVAEPHLEAETEVGLEVETEPAQVGAPTEPEAPAVDPMPDAPLPDETVTIQAADPNLPNVPDLTKAPELGPLLAENDGVTRRDVPAGLSENKPVHIVQTSSAEARIQGMLIAATPQITLPLVQGIMPVEMAIAPETEPVLGAVPDTKQVAEPSRPNAVQMPVTHTPPETAVKVSQQVATALVQHRDQLTEITLDPPELGKVKFQMATAENTAQVVLSVERPETGDLLRRHIDQLAKDLADLGYSDVQFQFASDRQSQGGQTQQNTLEIDAAETSEIAPPSPLTVVTGLDLRI